jgi:hypothetical protein
MGESFFRVLSGANGAHTPPLPTAHQFADLSAAEFKQRYLNYVPSLTANRTMADGIEDLPQGADALVDC